MKRLPYASDPAIRDTVKLILKQIELLYSSNPALCYQYLEIEGKSSKLDFYQHFTREVKQRELTVMANVISSAAKQREPPPKEKQVEKQLTKVLAILSQRYGDDVQLLDNPALSKKRKAKTCEVFYDLYKTILDLPEQESGPLLRYMFADAN